jgi:hypothetical protein
MSDELTRLLAQLPSAGPDPARARRIRTRCRARLKQQASRASASRSPVIRTRIATLWQPAIAILGVVYLTAGIVAAIQFYRLL